MLHRFIHVSVMVFVGFGFLMTFLKRYSNSAVALNFFMSCLVRPQAVLQIRLFSRLLHVLQMCKHHMSLLSLSRTVVAQRCKHVCSMLLTVSVIRES